MECSRTRHISGGIEGLEIHVRAIVGNCDGYSGEPICNYCLKTSLRGHAASNSLRMMSSSITIFYCRQFSRHRPTLECK